MLKMHAMKILPETVGTWSSRSGTNPYASLCLQSGSTDAADVSFRIFIAMLFILFYGFFYLYFILLMPPHSHSHPAYSSKSNWVNFQ